MRGNPDGASRQGLEQDVQRAPMPQQPQLLLKPVHIPTNLRRLTKVQQRIRLAHQKAILQRRLSEELESRTAILNLDDADYYSHMPQMSVDRHSSSASTRLQAITADTDSSNGKRVEHFSASSQGNNETLPSFSSRHFPNATSDPPEVSCSIVDQTIAEANPTHSRRDDVSPGNDKPLGASVKGLGVSQSSELTPISVELKQDGSRRKVAGLFAGRFVRRPKLVIRLSSWMANIHIRSIRFWDITLPGSHNSASWCLANDGRRRWSGVAFAFLKLYIHCQETTVYHQLQMGVRFLDLRVCKYLSRKGEPYCAHGGFRTVPLKEVLQQIAKFCESHPSEVIVLSIRRDVAFLHGPASLGILDSDFLVALVLRKFLGPHLTADITIGELADRHQNIVYFFEERERCLPSARKHELLSSDASRFIFNKENAVSDSLSETTHTSDTASEGHLDETDGLVTSSSSSIQAERSEAVLPRTDAKRGEAFLWPKNSGSEEQREEEEEAADYTKRFFSDHIMRPNTLNRVEDTQKLSDPRTFSALYHFRKSPSKVFRVESAPASLCAIHSKDTSLSARSALMIHRVPAFTLSPFLGSQHFVFPASPNASGLAADWGSFSPHCDAVPSRLGRYVERESVSDSGSALVGTMRASPHQVLKLQRRCSGDSFRVRSSSFPTASAAENALRLSVRSSRYASLSPVPPELSHYTEALIGEDTVCGGLQAVRKPERLVARHCRSSSEPRSSEFPCCCSNVSRHPARCCCLSRGPRSLSWSQGDFSLRVASGRCFASLPVIEKHQRVVKTVDPPLWSTPVCPTVRLSGVVSRCGMEGHDVLDKRLGPLIPKLHLERMNALMLSSVSTRLSLPFPLEERSLHYDVSPSARQPILGRRNVLTPATLSPTQSFPSPSVSDHTVDNLLSDDLGSQHLHVPSSSVGHDSARSLAGNLPYVLSDVSLSETQSEGNGSRALQFNGSIVLEEGRQKNLGDRSYEDAITGTTTATPAGAATERTVCPKEFDHRSREQSTRLRERCRVSINRVQQKESQRAKKVVPGEVSTASRRASFQTRLASRDAIAARQLPVTPFLAGRSRIVKSWAVTCDANPSSLTKKLVYWSTNHGHARPRKPYVLKILAGEVTPPSFGSPETSLGVIRFWTVQGAAALCFRNGGLKSAACATHRHLMEDVLTSTVANYVNGVTHDFVTEEVISRIVKLNVLATLGADAEGSQHQCHTETPDSPLLLI